MRQFSPPFVCFLTYSGLETSKEWPNKEAFIHFYKLLKRYWRCIMCWDIFKPFRENRENTKCYFTSPLIERANCGYWTDVNKISLIQKIIKFDISWFDSNRLNHRLVTSKKKKIINNIVRVEITRNYEGKLQCLQVKVTKSVFDYIINCKFCGKFIWVKCVCVRVCPIGEGGGVVNFFKTITCTLSVEFWNVRNTWIVTIVLTIFVLVYETTSCHEHVSLDWAKISRPQIITAESTVTSATITLLVRMVRLKGTFVEMYIDTRSRQFLVVARAGHDGCSLSQLTNLWWLAFDECASNYSYNKRSTARY